jgi:hypothetical protein
VFRIVRKSRERLIEDGYQAQLAERERLIQVLVEQIEHLRAQLGTPNQRLSYAALTPVQEPEPEWTPPPENGEPVSEDELEIQAMEQAGIVSPEQAAQMRAALERKNIIE